MSVWDIVSVCGTESRWTVRKPLWLEPCWQMGSPWTSTAPQRAVDQSFHKSEKTDFINTLLFFLLYLVLPFIFFQSFTQRNYWIFYCNRIKGALYFIFILIFEACLFNIISSQCEFTDGTARTHLGTEFARWAFSFARVITISWSILKCVFLYWITEK